MSPRKKIEAAPETPDPPVARRSVVDRIAKAAIAQVSAEDRPSERRQVKQGAEFLTAQVLRKDPFDQQAIAAELNRRGLDAAAIIDHCIPLSAEALGRGWVEDELSFTRVSAATSRLFGLSKAIGDQWDNLGDSDDALNILLVSFRREDHLLGPGILAQQLRRRMNSVAMMINADADMVERRLSDTAFDCMMVSVASLVSLDAAIDELADLKARTAIEMPVVLGGRALEHRHGRPEDFGVDLVTSDVDLALAKVSAMRAEANGRGAT